jgi:hypothetical protein
MIEVTTSSVCLRAFDTCPVRRVQTLRTPCFEFMQERFDPSPRRDTSYFLIFYSQSQTVLLVLKAYVGLLTLHLSSPSPACFEEW